MKEEGMMYLRLRLGFVWLRAQGFGFRIVRRVWSFLMGTDLEPQFSSDLQALPGRLSPCCDIRLVVVASEIFSTMTIAHSNKVCKRRKRQTVCVF